MCIYIVCVCIYIYICIYITTHTSEVFKPIKTPQKAHGSACTIPTPTLKFNMHQNKLDNLLK